MLLDHSGSSTLEWVVTAVIIVGIVGVAIYSLSQVIYNKLLNINVQLGS